MILAKTLFVVLAPQVPHLPLVIQLGQLSKLGLLRLVHISSQLTPTILWLWVMRVGSNGRTRQLTHTLLVLVLTLNQTYKSPRWTSVQFTRTQRYALLIPSFGLPLTNNCNCRAGDKRLTSPPGEFSGLLTMPLPKRQPISLSF